MITAAEKLRAKEAKKILKKQIKIKFGNLDAETISLINKADLKKIDNLCEKIITVDSEEEFINYIKY